MARAQDALAAQLEALSNQLQEQTQNIQLLQARLLNKESETAAVQAELVVAQTLADHASGKGKKKKRKK